MNDKQTRKESIEKEVARKLELLRIHQTLLDADLSSSVREGQMRVFHYVGSFLKNIYLHITLTLYYINHKLRNRELNTWEKKDLARRKYAERQLEKFIKWSIENKGYLKYKELIEYERKYFARNEK